MSIIQYFGNQNQMFLVILISMKLIDTMYCIERDEKDGIN